MAWKIKFRPSAEKDFNRLLSDVQKRILKFLREKVLSLNDPRMVGERLTSALSNCWKYRVGKYRIVVNIEDNNYLILVITVAKREIVYKG